jgi:WD40 repeat protein
MEGGARTVYVVKKHQSEEEKKSNTPAGTVNASGPMRLLTVSKEGAVFYRL